MYKYDYVIVGSGLFGATCAYELKERGKKVLVLEKRKHIGGNCYTENKNDKTRNADEKTPGYEYPRVQGIL